MKVTDLPIHELRPADWNANEVQPEMMAHLRESITQFGLVENLVVRPLRKGVYEVLGGNHKLQILAELGVGKVPCFVVDLDDAHARLLAQAMNHIHGEDNAGLRAELLRRVLGSVSQEDVLRLLPGTPEGLQALVSLGEEDLAAHLQAWQQSRAARLKLLQFRMTEHHAQVVRRAVDLALQQHADDEAGVPNARGGALYRICKWYLQAGDRA